MFASETQLKQMEKAIADIESAAPCEVRVAIDKRGGRYVLGGLRVLVLMIGMVEACGYALWANIPQYLFYVPLLLALFTPERILSLVPASRFFANKQEKQDELRRRAEAYFQKAELHATSTRNAVLLYFSLPERQFYFLTDSGLYTSWPQNLWQVYAQHLALSLQKGTAGDALLDLLSTIRTDAVKYLGARTQPKTQNELTDLVAFV